MLSQAGAPDPQDTDNMGAYAAAAYACGGYSADWNGSHLIVDCTAMLASLVGDKCSQALQERGRVQLEWLPYADIGTLQVYTRSVVLEKADKLCVECIVEYRVYIWQIRGRLGQDTCKQRPVEREPASFEDICRRLDQAKCWRDWLDSGTEA
ncbi:hypothetical protein PF003_g8830 [Phytophthora fragariae]|nr:hypothetical protein PF003_g8830 [Phytophthora fragariae]